MHRDNQSNLKYDLVTKGCLLVNPFTMETKRPRFLICIGDQDEIPIDIYTPEEMIEVCMKKKEELYKKYCFPFEHRYFFFELTAFDSFYYFSYDICTDDLSEAEALCEILDENEIFDTEDNEIIYL